MTNGRKYASFHFLITNNISEPIVARSRQVGAMEQLISQALSIAKTPEEVAGVESSKEKSSKVGFILLVLCVTV